jgi:DNA-binding transcriptional ArsR family regulator
MALGIRPTILRMLVEQEATVSQLAERLGKAPGTVGHHVQVLHDSGLVRVVRTEQVRAITAKYYGLAERSDDPSAPFAVLTVGLSADGASEWFRRAAELAEAMSQEKRWAGGPVTVVAGTMQAPEPEPGRRGFS